VNIPFILNLNGLYFVSSRLKFGIAQQIVGKGNHMKIKYILTVVSVLIGGHRDGWNDWLVGKYEFEKTFVQRIFILKFHRS
jgi:hypothetical protein